MSKYKKVTVTDITNCLITALRREESAIGLTTDYLLSDEYGGETQQEVADFLGVDDNTVSRATEEIIEEND